VDLEQIKHMFKVFWASGCHLWVKKRHFLLWWKEKEAGEVKAQPLSWRRKKFLRDTELFARFSMEMAPFKI
jgi:hypothetical protein